jgi:hypothetical protein
VRVHRSALRHGVTAEDGLYAAEHYVYVADLDDENPMREFRLGFDTAGRLLELVVAPVSSSGVQIQAVGSAR